MTYPPYYYPTPDESDCRECEKDSCPGKPECPGLKPEPKQLEFEGVLKEATWRE